MTLQEFKLSYPALFEELLTDTWLCKDPIDVGETKACWHILLKRKEETVSLDDFEKTFGITFQDITDWWNGNILKV